MSRLEKLVAQVRDLKADGASRALFDVDDLIDLLIVVEVAVELRQEVGKCPWCGYALEYNGHLHDMGCPLNAFEGWHP